MQAIATGMALGWVNAGFLFCVALGPQVIKKLIFSDGFATA